MLDQFITWLKTQPPEGEIDQSSWEVCAVGEFLASQGYDLSGPLCSYESGNPVYEIDQEAEARGVTATFLGANTYGEILDDLKDITH